MAVAGGGGKRVRDDTTEPAPVTCTCGRVYRPVDATQCAPHTLQVVPPLHTTQYSRHTRARLWHGDPQTWLRGGINICAQKLQLIYRDHGGAIDSIPSIRSPGDAHFAAAPHTLSIASSYNHKPKAGVCVCGSAAMLCA